MSEDSAYPTMEIWVSPPEPPEPDGHLPAWVRKATLGAYGDGGQVVFVFLAHIWEDLRSWAESTGHIVDDAMLARNVIWVIVHEVLHYTFREETLTIEQAHAGISRVMLRKEMWT